MLRSIRVRLVLSYLAVISVAMGISAFLLLSFLQQYFVDSVRDGLVAQAQITAQALVPGARAPEPAAANASPLYNSLQQQSQRNFALQAQNIAPPGGAATAPVDLSYLTDASLQLSSQLDTRIRVLDAAGTVLVDSGSAPAAGGRGSSLRSDAFIGQALGGRSASAVRDGAAGAPSVVHVALPLLVNGRVAGAVYLSQSLSDTAAVLADVRARLLLSAGIALALSTIAGLVLAGAIARPIRRLTRAAEAVASGDLASQVPVESPDEIGRLSRTFNEMTGRLRAAREMQVDFVANVSHELRTPLASIRAMVESLRDGAVDDLEVRDRFLGTVEAETARMTRLVNDLLVLSQADSQALAIRPEPVDLLDLAGQAAARLSPGAAAAGVRISLIPPDRPTPAAWADARRMDQVLTNILANAIQYSPPGGEVTVCLDRPGAGSVRLTVRDQGIGIPAEALPHIGERFYRTDRARSRAAGGSGLGLAIARALVEAQGGTLQIESEEGRGTVVSITLPQSRAHPAQWLSHN
jgi:signal transduction histidine kinase